MDPDTALEKARAALARYNSTEGTAAGRIYAAVDLADAFEALDGWLTKGGFLPAAWAASRGRP